MQSHLPRPTGNSVDTILLPQTASLPDPVIDTDEDMESVPEAGTPEPPSPADARPDEAGAVDTSIVIRIGPRDYASAVGRVAKRVEANNPETARDSEASTDQQEAGEPGAGIMWPQKPSSGPIKGFTPKKVFDNLDPLIREAWEEQAQDAVFVHYFDGGYTPTVAQNVQTIIEDLQSECDHA